MIDYFALLDQPHAPWLDPDELKNSYHQKTLQAHPDARASHPGAGATDAAFARLNEAYQVLQDPKRRLHHLLSLEDRAPSSGDQTVPRQLHDLFPRVAALVERTRALMGKLGATSNALSRSLLKPQLIELQEDANTLREEIQHLTDKSLDRLRQINPTWANHSAEEIEDLSNLYFVFAFLGRWSAQLDEMTFQLSLH